MHMDAERTADIHVVRTCRWTGAVVREVWQVLWHPPWRGLRREVRYMLAEFPGWEVEGVEEAGVALDPLLWHPGRRELRYGREYLMT